MALWRETILVDELLGNDSGRQVGGEEESAFLPRGDGQFDLQGLGEGGRSVSFPDEAYLLEGLLCL